MPWSNQSGGNGGWKSGGGRGSGGPWGQGGGSGGGGQPPDLEEMLRRSQDRMKQVMGGGGGVPGWLMFLGAMVAFLFIAWHAFFFQVRPNEQGIVMRFGAFYKWAEPGLQFRLPYPIEEVRLLEVTTTNQIEVGYRSQGYSGDRRMGRTGSGLDVPEESLMLTADENIVDIDFVVQWFIDRADHYLFNIQDPDQTVKDVAESAMREVIGKSKVGDVLAPGREPIEAAVRQLMQQILDSYGAGVKISQVKVQQAQAPTEVRAAFDDVIAAIQDRDRAQNEARAYANKVVPEARGEAQGILQKAQAYKEQTVADATGQTARFLSVYEQYKNAPDVTRKRIYLETMERVLGGSDKIILDSKSGQGVVPYLPLDQLQKPKKTEEGGN